MNLSLVIRHLQERAQREQGSRVVRFWQKIVQTDSSVSGCNKSRKNITPPHQEEVFSSRKHHMQYITDNGIILRTGYSSKTDSISPTASRSTRNSAKSLKLASMSLDLEPF